MWFNIPLSFLILRFEVTIFKFDKWIINNNWKYFMVCFNN
jgi:hypothetical protein